MSKINMLFRPFKKRFAERSSCRLVMTILTRDSEDVLQKNIEFHLGQGVDFFIVMDHLSTDETRDILRGYEKLGVLHYIYQPSEAFHQFKWATSMARMARSRFGASWVINNDSDEFWWPNQSNQTLKQFFMELSESVNVLRCYRSNFIYSVNSDPQQSFLDRMIYKEQHSTNALNETLPPKVAHRGSRIIKLGAGNHSVSGIGKQNIVDGNIDILHFPFRNLEQMLDKIRLGGQIAARRKPSEKIHTNWRKLYQDLQNTDNVDQFLSKYAYTPEKLKTGIASGELIEDTRLRDYMSSIETRTRC